MSRWRTRSGVHEREAEGGFPEGTTDISGRSIPEAGSEIAQSE